MTDLLLEASVFSFEDMLPALDLLPLAARRALNHAGLRLSLEGWRSLAWDERREVVLAGAEDHVDAVRIFGIVAHAQPSPLAIEAVPDPDPRDPPSELVEALPAGRPLDAETWSGLRSLDRFALAHAHRHGVVRDDPSRLRTAAEAILPSRGYALPRVSLRPPALPSFAEPRLSFAPTAPVPDPFAAPEPQPLSDPYKPLSTHLGPTGEVRMVDVGPKPPTARRAVASGAVHMLLETAQRVARKDSPKGEVLATARIAAIMAAKRTSDWIPLCHAVSLSSVKVQLDVDTELPGIHVTVEVEAFDRTGVEMEAMVGASTACLTIYDMLKGIDRGMTIEGVKLLEKSGGRSGRYRRSGEAP